MDVSGRGRELAQAIRNRPRDFSPGAALRPLVQDACLPLAAYVGGPAELLYGWQIDPLYRAAGVVRSGLWPRLSATFLPKTALRALRKAGRTPPDIFPASEDRSESCAETEEEQRILALAAGLVDYTERFRTRGNDRPLSRAQKAILHQAEKIRNRVREDRLEREGRGRKVREALARAILPGGKPQERVTNVLQFLAAYGPDFVAACLDGLDPLAPGHQVVSLDSLGGQP